MHKEEGVVYIAPNLFVIPFDKTTAWLAELIVTAKNERQEVRILILEESPDWIHLVPPVA
jgi:Iap family predicted aminopeptidase